MQVELLRLKRTPRVLSTKAMLDEVDGVIEFVSDLSRGVGKQEEETKMWSQFWQLVIKRSECFYSKPVPAETALAITVGATSVLVGRPALRLHFNELEKKMTEVFPTARLAELMPLKAFRWVFSPAEMQKVKQWAGVLAHQLVSLNRNEHDLSSSAAPKICTKGAASPGNGAVVVASSTTAMPTASGSKKGPVSKKQADKDEKNLANNVDMMKFFGKRKKPDSYYRDMVEC